jgi:hypothetical protein
VDGDVEIVSSSYYESGGYLYIVGEVRNDTPGNAKLVRVTATYLDAENATLGTAFAFVQHDILAAGQISPFVIEQEVPAGFASYTLLTQWSPGETAPVPQLSLGSIRDFVDSYGFRIWVGEVTNGSLVAVEQVKLVLTLYDASGTVSNVDYAFLFNDVLAPGQKGPFQLAIFVGPSSYVTRTLTTNARPASSPPPILRSLGVKQLVGPGGGPRFTGQIQNLGTGRVSQVRAVVTLYDAQGAVVNASYDLADPSALEPGEKASFDVLFPEAYQGWTSYGLYPPTELTTPTPTATRTATATHTATITDTPAPTATLITTATQTPPPSRWDLYLPLLLRLATR